MVTIQDKDGNDVAAYEIAFKLNVIALQNSISSQEILDFKKGCSKYCGLKLGFRNTIKVPRCKPSGTAHSACTQVYDSINSLLVGLGA